MPNRDLIVIGASAGGIEALQTICRDLPADLPAAVLAIIHTSPQSGGMLPRILSRAGSLPAAYPYDGEPIESGRIYVAPVDMHLIVENGRLRTVRGPRENRHRPAIDPTFRSAARSYGRRAIGVVLTGSLDDGTSGLMVICANGGTAVVQDPQTAMFPSMPMNALKRVPDAMVIPLQRIGEQLTNLAKESLPAQTEAEMASIAIYSNKVECAEHNMPELEEIQSGKPSAFACPECGGVLWEIDQEGFLRFRCRVGHAYSSMNLRAEQRLAVETSLWAALRALEDTAALYRRMAARAQGAKQDHSYHTFTERADGANENAKTLREFLVHLQTPESELEGEHDVQ